MLKKSQLNNVFLSCCTKIGVILCLAMLCSVTANAQCNSQYDIDFSNSLGVSNGTLLDGGVPMALPDNLGGGSTCTCDDGNVAGDNCYEMEILNTGTTTCATVELDASNGYVVDPTADCSTIDEGNTSVNIDLTQSTTVLICKSSGGNLTVQRLTATPCPTCDLVVVCPPANTAISCNDDVTDLFGLIGGAIDSTVTAPCGDVMITNDFVSPGACGGDVLTTFTIMDTVTTTVCTSTITVNPPAAPVITACAPDMGIVCSADVVADITQVVFTTDCGVGAVVAATPVAAAGTNSACGESPGDSYTIRYIVSDDCGRSASCLQTFTIVGPKPTIIACAPDAVVDCVADIVADITAVQVESCGLNETVVAGAITPAGTNSACGEFPGDIYTIEYTVSDDCGSVNTCVQTFTIAAPPPTITCPLDIEVTCFADIAADIGAVAFTTSCGIGATVAAGPVNASTGNSVCGESPGDSYNIEYSVTTDCGRIATCIQTFTITNPGPVITSCAADMNVECVADIAANITAVAFTSCDGGVVTAGAIVADAANSACGETAGDQYTIEYTVTDNCGFMATCIQTFTITNIGPTITCPAGGPVACAADISVSIDDATVTTSCGLVVVVTLSEAAIAGQENCSGTTYTYTYTVEDECGRTASCERIFTIADNSPTITCPADATVACAANIIPGIADFQTNCNLGGSIAVTGPVRDGEPNCPGTTYTYTFTGTDECGQQAVCEQVFTIENDEPTITCPPDMMVTCPAKIVVGTPSFNTSCQLGGSVFVSQPEIDGPPNCDGTTYTYTFIGTDVCGRADTCQQVFTIVNSGPTITCPAGGDITCEDDILLNDFPIVNTDCLLDADTERTGPFIVGEPNCAGTTYTYTYITTDACGRVATCDQVFTVVNDGPTITCPADETVECAADITVGMPSFTTSCDLGANISTLGPTLASGDADCPGATYEIEYTVTDDCGRMASCTQTFTIDNAGPTITCPADEVVTCAADIVASTPTFTTSCGLGGSVAVSGLNLVSGTADCPGATYEIEYIVTDDCGRTANCIQTFTIDNVGPGITCPANATVACSADILVDPANASFTTSCGLGANVTVSTPVITGDADCPGTTYTYTYTVEDACGRTASCNQVFTIDNDEPMITTCPEDCPVACASDIRPGTPEFTTSCGLGGTLSFTGPVVDGDPHCDGTTYTYTHIVTDDCGRTASCQQVFTIVNECHLVDFDFDDEGNPLAPSLEIFDQYQDFTVTTDNPYRCVQLFDTENPTSHDFDLGTPNEQYGGPGIGAGGVNNTEFQGNALIVSKDCGVPNETEGQLIFTFDCSVTIKTVDLLDMKCGESEIELYDEHHNLIEYLPIPGYGVNSFNTFDVFVSGVYTMIVDLDCGGGVTAFKYCKDNAPGTDCEAPDPVCEDYNLDFDNAGYHWMTNATSGSFDVGDQNYTISIMDDDNILEDTYENHGGLLIGIDPHDTDDEVVVCYNLSQVSDNVSFDIHDLDYKNYTSSKQQEAVCVYGLLGDDPTQILPTVTSLDGHVDVDGNCAEATTDSAQSHDDESVLVEFDECIDKVVIVYGTGSNSPTHDPSYSKITIGKRFGFNSEVCPGDCVDCSDGLIGGGGDDDGDGVCNDVDVCPGGDDNQDRDGDGIPDACDDICYDYNIDHGDCGAGWQHGDESGTVELGLENIAIDILDEDNILENTNADGAGLLVGIDPHTVDDELIVCYTLSQSSSNVVFDIVDLDYKNSGSRQQEAVCIYGTLGNNPTQILPTVSSLDGHVDVDGNCAEATTNSASSGDDESILVEFTECIDKITIVYGTGSNSPTHDPSYSKITIGESIFSVEQCKDGCDEPCPIVGSGGGDGDEDNDGVCDGEDICPGGDDFMDTDGDGTPDFCDDDCTAGTGAPGDSDGDFVCDDVDQCDGFDDNIDENNNGIPDGCDVECEDYTLDFAEPGYNWSGHSLMDSYTVGNQTFDIRIIDGDGILENSHDRASGLAIGTDPHDVNDEVVICYNLSEVASNVIFDIIDLDYKDGGSRQQEAVCVYGTLGADPTQIMPIITSLDGTVAISGNCAEATANSSVSGRDESILVEFTECIDKVTIVYGTGSNSPTHDPDYGKITIGHDVGFVTEVCTNTCPEPRVEDEANAHISLYPNPVYGSSNVTIEIDTEARGDAQVVLTDALGRMVSSENIQLVDDLTIHQFNTNQLAAGVYFVQLQTNEWRTDGLKLVVVKP